MNKVWLCCCLLCTCFFCGCKKQVQFDKSNTNYSPSSSSPSLSSVSIAEGKELFSVADSREDAETIAELYSVELVEYINGVASFHTEEDLNAVIQRGAEHGWPLLEINYVSKLF